MVVNIGDSEFINLVVRWREQDINYRNAIANSGVNPEDIGQMVFVTSTEISFPGIDTLVIDNLELPKDIFRSPIYNQGCSPALRGLAAAKHFCMDNPGK